MPLVYATPEQLTTFLGAPAPANAAKLLRAASALVRSATRTAIYTVTATGIPSDPDVAEAFRDATCAQAEAWITLGIDPTAGPAGVGGTPQSSSIGGASINYGPRAAAQDQDKADTLTRLVPDALWYLDSAGVLSGPVGSY